MIHKTAEVSEKATIGIGTRVWNNVQIRERAVIGDDCVISKDCYIDQDVSIGNRVKIQNGVSVYKGVFVEDDCFLGPHCIFTNDLRPRSFNKEWTLTPTFLKRGCSIGAGAVILCGVTVGAYAMIGAGAVLTQDAEAFGLYVGNPARLKGWVNKIGERVEPTW